VDLLAALLEDWPTGKLTSMYGRGGFRLDMSAEDSFLTQIMINAIQVCRVRAFVVSRPPAAPSRPDRQVRLLSHKSLTLAVSGG